MNIQQITDLVEQSRAEGDYWKETNGLYLLVSRQNLAIAELQQETANLQARLDQNTCNSGHTTLPIILWDCPECVRIAKEKMQAEIAELRAVVDPMLALKALEQEQLLGIPTADLAETRELVSKVNAALAKLTPKTEEPA